MIKLTECPRDAMQGVVKFIPTALKIKYINALLKIGFDVIDFGSFVSSKAIPQLKDTSTVLSGLDLLASNTQLLAVVANERGAEEASKYEEIDILGFPFSISEEFQLRNTKKTREQAFETVKKIKDICELSHKKMRVYLSMGFGNPYGEKYSSAKVLDWAHRLAEVGIQEFAISDTTGVSNPVNIKSLFDMFSNELGSVEVSAHFHSSPHNWKEKIVAAYNAGCRSFDSTLMGYGGCPFAKDELVGNIATENLVEFFSDQLTKPFDVNLLKEALTISSEVFD
jgi:hydroxymethylglutaryl-CoA lyase